MTLSYKSVSKVFFVWKFNLNAQFNILCFNGRINSFWLFFYFAKFQNRNIFEILMVPWTWTIKHCFTIDCEWFYISLTFYYFGKEKRNRLDLLEIYLKMVLLYELEMKNSIPLLNGMQLVHCANTTMCVKLIVQN